MNVYAPSAAYPLTELWRETPALTDFARAGAMPRRSANARSVGIVAVLAIHALMLAAYVFAGPALVQTQTQQMLTVVDVLAEPPNPEPPPPLPNLAPPIVYVPV